MKVIAVVASRSSSCPRRLLPHLECVERDDGDGGDVRHTVDAPRSVPELFLESTRRKRSMAAGWCGSEVSEHS